MSETKKKGNEDRAVFVINTIPTSKRKENIMLFGWERREFIPFVKRHGEETWNCNDT